MTAPTALRTKAALDRPAAMPSWGSFTGSFIAAVNNRHPVTWRARKNARQPATKRKHHEHIHTAATKRKHHEHIHTASLHPSPTVKTMRPTKRAGVIPKAAARRALVPATKPTKIIATSGKPAPTRPAAPPVLPHAPNAEQRVTHVEIATRGYFINVSAGCPQGRELQHWLEAEAQLTRR